MVVLTLLDKLYINLTSELIQIEYGFRPPKASSDYKCLQEAHFSSLFTSTTNLSKFSHARRKAQDEVKRRVESAVFSLKSGCKVNARCWF